MLLYKNVDICDLEPIAKNGILSIDECGNNNWDEGKRAENDTSWYIYLARLVNRTHSLIMVRHCWRFNVKQRKIKLVKQIRM